MANKERTKSKKELFDKEIENTIIKKRISL